MKARWRYVRDGLLVLGVVVLVGLWQTRNLLPDSEPAPRLTVLTSDGKPTALGEGAGKPTLVYFFAPWCGVCKFSIDNAKSVLRLLGASRVQVMAVALDFESPRDVAEFVAAHASDVPYYLGSTAVRDAYKIDAYPTYYVLDAEGRIVHASVGYSTLLGMLARILLA